MPNVMACRHRVTGGESVETQNVLGGRTLDLLQAADFIFPHGIDHHRLFAGIPGVSAMLTRLARRIAGLGRLPEKCVPRRPARVRTAEALIVGGGRAGLSAAQCLGARALLVDDGLELGGAVGLVEPSRAATLREAARVAGAELSSETTALGLYREPDRNDRLVALLASPSGAEIVYPRAVLIATGGHDSVPDFANNDVPGIFSARAGVELLRGGVRPGRQVALVGRGGFADVLQAELGSEVRLRIPDAHAVECVHGRQRVTGITWLDRGRRQRSRVDALLFAAPETPAVELWIQAGGQVTFEAERGYVPILAPKAPANVWCIGGAAGNPSSEVAELRAVAERVAEALASH
jgi:sarcosine oxidase subunit alpha